MADSTTTINIRLRSTADTSGADKINASLGITTQREQELLKMRQQMLTAEEREVAEVERLRASYERQQQETSKLTEAYHRLAASQKTVNTEVAANPWTTASRGIQVNHEQIRRLNNVHELGVRSTRNHAQSLYVFSQGLEDLQYGIRGVLNNIPQLVLAMGGGAGLAGVISIAAVALTNILPKLGELAGLMGSDKVRKEGLDALLKQLGEAPAVTDVATASQKRFHDQINADQEALKRVSEALQQQITLMQLRNAAAKSESAFRLEQGVQDIKAQKLDPQEEARQIERLKIDEAARTKRLADEEAIARLAQATQERDAKQNAANDFELKRQQELARNTERLQQLKNEAEALQEYLNIVEEATALEAESPERDKARAAVAANQAAQAAVGPLGNLTALGMTVPEAQAEAAKKRADADAAARAANDLAQQEALKAQERQREFERQRERASREAQPGVYGPNRVQTQSPFGGPAPLPTAPGGVLPAGYLPPAPLGAAGGTAAEIAAKLAEANAALAALGAGVQQLAQTAKTAERAAKNNR